MISAKEVEDAYDLLKPVVTKTPLQLDPYLSNKYHQGLNCQNLYYFQIF